MKHLLNNLLTLICLAAAITLCARGQDGWSWFLFIGLILAAGPSIPERR